MSTTKIEWAEVPGYDGYFASKEGLIEGPSGKILKPQRNPSGHLYILANRPGVPRKLFVHRAVLMAHKGTPPEGNESRHLNGNPFDNRLQNLEWSSRTTNQRDRKRHGTDNKPHKSIFSKLNPEDIPKIKKLSGLGISSRDIAKSFGTSHTTIQKIVRGERWIGYGG